MRKRSPWSGAWACLVLGLAGGLPGKAHAQVPGSTLVWDYDTCGGRAGRLGAANPHGIADDYMQQFTAKYVSPLVNGADPGLPLRERVDLVTKGWNVVYLPYCTGQQPPLT